MTHINIKDMANFSRSKNGRYNYYDGRNCPLAQFARDVLGIAFPMVDAVHYTILDESYHGKPVATYDRDIENALNAATTRIYGAVDSWETLTIQLDVRVPEPVGIHITADDTTKKLEYLS